MIARLPSFKPPKNHSFDRLAVTETLPEKPGEDYWHYSMGYVLVHHPRFLLTSLHKDLYAIPATNCSIQPTQWAYFLNEDATISIHNNLHLPMGARIVEFKHTNITSKHQLPIDSPIERHAWVRIRDPNTDKRNLSEDSKQTLQWILTSLLPLLSSIPLNRACHLTINAAADAFATDDTMGIGFWFTVQSSTYWFSQIWNTNDLQTFLPISKELQRYIASWEALAQLCIILTVFQTCETRPGIINIQSGSDNTGAEANTNHGFSTTEVLADIIKLVSITQIQCNTVLNVHHIPGEKNIDADNPSRGKLSSFPDELRVYFDLNVIFDRTPFPRYINKQVQWDPLAIFGDFFLGLGLCCS